MNNTSKTSWDRVDAMTEADIDTSDIPPLTAEFSSKSQWWKPIISLNVPIQIDPDTLDWFQSQGENYEQKMAAALRIYANAHRA